MERFLSDRNGFEAELTTLADEALGTGTLPRSPEALLGKVLSKAGVAEALEPLDGKSGYALPADIFDAFAYPGREEMRRHFERVFEVVAAPGTTIDDHLEPGDLLLRRALSEGGLAHLSILATGTVFRLEDLDSAALTPEGGRNGVYAQVVEGGPFPHNTQDRFARRLASESGRLGYDQMILRLRQEVVAPGIDDGAPVGTPLSGSRLRERAEDLEQLQEKSPTIVVERVEVHSSDTHKIASVLPKGKDHFVCVKDTGDIVLQAIVKPDTRAARDKVVWKAVGATITSPAVGGDKTTARLSSADSGKIPISIEIDGTTVYDGFVWVVWSVSCAVPLLITTEDLSSGGRLVRLGDGASGPGLRIKGECSFGFTIKPAEIITDKDRPDLSGPNTVPVPGATQTHVVTGFKLEKGADKKWDASRQVRVKVLNPNLYPTDKLPKVGGHLWNYQPTPEAVPEGYPTDKVLGNDDTQSSTDENNDPYTNDGIVATADSPAFSMGHSTGANGDTFEIRFHYIEFLRVNLANEWYRASNDVPWRIHLKFRKQGGAWKDDGSDLALNNDGF